MGILVAGGLLALGVMAGFMVGFTACAMMLDRKSRRDPGN